MWAGIRLTHTWLQPIQVASCNSKKHSLSDMANQSGCNTCGILNSPILTCRGWGLFVHTPNQ